MFEGLSEISEILLAVTFVSGILLGGAVAPIVLLLSMFRKRY